MHSKLLHLSAGLVLSAAFCTPALADQSKPKGYSTDQPKIVLTTGEDLDEWTFIINADEEEMGNVWVDLNNNGTCDEDEPVTNFGGQIDFTCVDKKITIYGNITGLNCAQNDLTSIDISGAPQLLKLLAGRNQLKKIDLSHNANLQELYLYKNQITTLDPTPCQFLLELDVDENKLNEINLSNCPNLTKFSCTRNAINTLDLSSQRNLRILYCGGNNLTSLDLSKCEELREATCANNLLENISIAANKKLKEFYCAANKFTTLDVSQNTKIELLDCRDNQLTSLDVSNLYELHTLACGYNRLNTLTFPIEKDGKHAGLINLYAQSNALSHLALERTPDMKVLYVMENNFSELELELIPQLTLFSCSSNPIKELSTGANSMLRTLGAANAQLKSLDLSSNRALMVLQCYGNEINGEAMTAMIASLPARSAMEPGEAFVVNTPKGDKNVIRQADVEAAKKIHWQIFNFLDGVNEGRNPYEGVEVGIQTPEVVNPSLSLMSSGRALYIKMEGKATQDQLYVIDAAGRTALTQKLDKGSNVVALPNLAGGVYVARIGQWNQKFSIQ